VIQDLHAQGQAGINEFAGYLAVGLVAFLTGWIASEYGVRPYPFYLGIIFAVAGLLLSIFLHHPIDDLNKIYPCWAPFYASPASHAQMNIIFLLEIIISKLITLKPATSTISERIIIISLLSKTMDSKKFLSMSFHD